jgi:tetratricopeptide (TPR) repeat protein
MNSARENHERYSTLHMRDEREFVCEEIKDDFDAVVKIICAYDKRPSQMVKKIQNDFFAIDSIIKDETFFLLITPYEKIKLLPVLFDLTKEDSVYEASAVSAKHWMVIGYKNQLPLTSAGQKSDMAINFPFYMDADKLPFVGALDIKGNPIRIQKVGDVTEYLKVKKFFEEKNYDSILESIEEVLASYPNTLFKAELLYYKLKVFDKLKDYDNALLGAKTYLREYSSDENVPEVLSLIAKAYASIGLETDANYFFDRLFSEHENSVYAQWGYVYQGDMLDAAGGTNEAIRAYEKALNSTQDLELAATAAYNLARVKIAYSLKDSATYIKKIVDGKPDFFVNDLSKSTDMMTTFSESGDYITAASIARALYSSLSATHDDYEGLLKDSALWLAKTENKKEALFALNKYIQEFPDGDYISEIQVAKDALFFDTQELNSTARLVEYDKLIQEYPNDSIGNRAIYEKAKFLLQNNKFNEVLDFKEDLMALDKEKYEDVDNIILDSAVGAMQVSLEAKQCHDVLRASNDYNVTLGDKWDDGIYECAMKGGDFELAKSMANKHFKSSDLEMRKKWLYRYVEIDFRTGNYSDALNASKDLIALIDDAKTSQYNEAYRYIFDTYQRLEQNDNVLAAIVDIDNAFGVDYKDLDRYMTLVNIGHERKDDNIVIKYGSMANKIQQDSQSNPQSPLLEFTLYQAYVNQEKYNDALKTIESLNNVEIDKTQRARQKYLLGTVYSKLWRDEDAAKAYAESVKADETSPWAKLARSALQI